MNLPKTHQPANPKPSIEECPTTPINRAVVDTLRDERGLSTIEYAMGILAAAAMAGLLYLIINSGGVREAIEGIITDALNSTP